ncbi:hypothetical protein GQ457_11G025170 [Hibiscus cannabinus]
MVNTSREVVDATVRGGFGEACIGGVLRDHRGNILARFLRPLGISVPTGANLAAILKACQIFSKLHWSESHKLMIESDSLLVVKWINDIRCTLSFFVELANKCCDYCVKKGWKVGFEFRESNGIVHLLARKGIGRNQLILWQ